MIYLLLNKFIIILNIIQLPIEKILNGDRRKYVSFFLIPYTSTAIIALDQTIPKPPTTSTYLFF